MPSMRGLCCLLSRMCLDATDPGTESMVLCYPLPYLVKCCVVVISIAMIVCVGELCRKLQCFCRRERLH
jgi:hypothetical protein